MAEMTTQDLIKNCNELEGSDEDWKRVYANLQLSVKTPEYRIFRAGNTLFWVRIISSGVGQVFVFNADPKDKLFSNVLEFLRAMKIAEYTQLHTVLPSEDAFIRIREAGYVVDVKPFRTAQGPIKFKGTVHV
jgi:hypothetical protein